MHSPTCMGSVHLRICALCVVQVVLIILIAIGLSLQAHAVVLVLPLFLALYVVQNLWKPWAVAAVSDLMGKKRRALVLSVDSLIQTSLAFLLAPVAGYVAHEVSLELVFLSVGVSFLIINFLLLRGGGKEPPSAQALPGTPPGCSGLAPESADARMGLQQAEEGATLPAAAIG